MATSVPPDLTTRTPFRISFFGGGTDYPAWYRQYGGAVLATTINKYCYVSCYQSLEAPRHRYRVVDTEEEITGGINWIDHPTVRAALSWAGYERALEILHRSDLPVRSGIGSSSSFTVGLVNALMTLKGQPVSTDELARIAVHIEQDLVGESVGEQDQVSAVFGGFNHIRFHPDHTFQVIPVTPDPARLLDLQNSLMLFHTGVSRTASDIAAETIDNIPRRTDELRGIRELVDQAIAVIMDPSVSLDEFGRLLDLGWRYKRRLSGKVTTPEIDRIYDKAIQMGATGGKMLGAGGGGFMLLFVKPALQNRMRSHLHPLTDVPFAFDQSGSCIVEHPARLVG